MEELAKKIQLEKQIAQLEKKIKSIESSAAFRKENAIKKALANLMKKHACSETDLIALLQHDANAPAQRSRAAAASKSSRKPRIVKIFKNPHTGEIVETRGGNHKVLKVWKTENKLADINEWLVGTRD